MNASRFLKAFQTAGKRVHLIGDLNAGVIVALDMEGRLFTVLNGEVLNRTNLDAIAGESTQKVYLNPGGDGLWPAPEGTRLGYQYSTGAWRVSAGLRAARYVVTKSAKRSVEIVAEVDLINAQGLGVPTLFKRVVQIAPQRKAVTMRTLESITYIGGAELRRSECLLAPWSLCQFDCGPGCEVVFPSQHRTDVWDLYPDSSDAQRDWIGGLCRTATNGSLRYQIGIGQRVPWIEYRDPSRGLVVRRTAGSLPGGQSYIDIRDAAPQVAPVNKGVRYSVYSDTANFMEIEAVGGCPTILRPNTELSVVINTRFARI